MLASPAAGSDGRARLLPTATRSPTIAGSPSIEGIIPALVTPFNSAEDLDLAALGRIVEKTIAAGVHGVFAVGSQGEFWALTPDEQRAVVETTVEVAAGRVPVYAGVTAITTRATLELARAAQDAGADALTVLPPFFVSPTQAELERHFTAVADESDVPIVLYNQPARTGVTLTTALVARLAEHPQIAAVKDSSGSINQTTAYIRAVPEDFAVLSGNDAQIAWARLAGAAGAIASTANVAPELSVGIFEAIDAGDLDRARELQEKLSFLRDAFDYGTFPVIVKEALALLGEPVGPCRAPVGPLSDEAREDLRAALTAAGCLTA